MNKISVKHFDLNGKFYEISMTNFNMDGNDSCMFIEGEYESDKGDKICLSVWAKSINNEWWLSHDELPAYVSHKGVCFFQNGYSIPIDQMNCDQTMKVIYTLKYEHIINNFHLYKAGS